MFSFETKGGQSNLLEWGTTLIGSMPCKQIFDNAKNLGDTNTLAYCTGASIIRKKSFITLGTECNFSQVDETLRQDIFSRSGNNPIKLFGALISSVPVPTGFKPYN